MTSLWSWSIKIICFFLLLPIDNVTGPIRKQFLVPSLYRLPSTAASEASQPASQPAIQPTNDSAGQFTQFTFQSRSVLSAPHNTVSCPTLSLQPGSPHRPSTSMHTRRQYEKYSPRFSDRKLILISEFSLRKKGKQKEKSDLPTVSFKDYRPTWSVVEASNVWSTGQGQKVKKANFSL